MDHEFLGGDAGRRSTLLPVSLFYLSASVAAPGTSASLRTLSMRFIVPAAPPFFLSTAQYHTKPMPTSPTPCESNPALAPHKSENDGCWNSARIGFFGGFASKRGKGGKAGIWNPDKIAPFFLVNTENKHHLFAWWKIEGSRMYITSDTYSPGPMQVRIEEVQYARGLCQRWLVDCFFWKTLIHVLYFSLSHSAEKGEWAKCPMRSYGTGIGLALCICARWPKSCRVETLIFDK